MSLQTTQSRSLKCLQMSAGSSVLDMLEEEKGFIVSRIKPRDLDNPDESCVSQ